MGVVGRPVAGDPAFDYSPQLQAARANGERWTKERLDTFLSDPQAMYPGTWMGSPPIRDAKQRADLLCVLDRP
jgi:cytochrome c